MRDWSTILLIAAAIVNQYDSGVTLRQLFYRLVSAGLIHNNQNDYKQLSSRTAEARRFGLFPPLIDQTREIHRLAFFDGPADAARSAAKRYYRDRTAGQVHHLLIGGEKATLQALLWQWFGALGCPIILLRGYTSQTYADEISMHIDDDGRPAVLIYAGDLDASGEDIQRDLVSRVKGLQVVRVALTPDQVDEYGLVKAPGKKTDSRARGFARKHGELFQVEVEALPPDTLRDLYQRAVDDHWDDEAYNAVLEQETEERQRLAEWAEELDD